MNYENLTDEQKEIYVNIIQKYLQLNTVTIENITPDIEKEVDMFLQELHDCTKRIKIFTNIFSKANTIIGLIVAIGKEKSKEELEKAFKKLQNAFIPCYSVLKNKYAQSIALKIFGY